MIVLPHPKANSPVLPDKATWIVDSVGLKDIYFGKTMFLDLGRENDSTQVRTKNFPCVWGWRCSNNNLD